MKKSIVSIAALVVIFAASPMPASAAMGGGNPRPQAMGGGNPRPQASWLDGAYAAAVALFGL